MADVSFDPGQLNAALIEQLDDALSGPEGLVQQAIDRSHEQLRGFDYDTDSVEESVQITEARADPDAGRISIAWEWTHPAAGFFETGTSRHQIQGQPVLSFVWQDPPQWVREEFDQARDDRGRFASGWRVFFTKVEVEGIERTRFATVGREWLAKELARRFG